MADSNKKHPAHEHIDTFESVVTREPKAKPQDINKASNQLETSLADKLSFEKAEEAEATAIRTRLEALLIHLPEKNTEVKKSRKRVEALIGKIQIKEVTKSESETSGDSANANQASGPDSQATGPAPKAQSEISKLKEVLPANEHAFIDAVDKFTEDKPEAKELFLKAIELGKIETSVAWIADLKEKVGNTIKNVKSTQNPEKRIPGLFKTGLEPHKTAITKALESWQEAEFYVTLGLGKINKEMNQVYTILSINPNTITDPAKRKYYADIQKEIQAKLDEIRTAFPRSEIEPKGLKDKKAKAQEIQATLKGIEEEIKYFNDELLTELPPDIQNLYKNEKAVVQTATNIPQNTPTATPAQSAPIGPVVQYRNQRVASPQTDEDEELNTPLNEERPNRPAQNVNTETNTPSASPDKLSNEVRELLKSLLPKKGLVSDENAVCLAINKLIQTSGVDIAQLKQFLQNPEFLNKTIPEAAKQAVVAEIQSPKMVSKGVDTLDKLKTALEDELNDIEEFARSVQGRRPLQTESDKLKVNSERKAAIRNLNRTLQLMIALEKRTMTYESPREILALVNFFINKDNTGMTMEEINENINGQIDKQKEQQYKGWKARVNQACFFLRPTMSSTLRAVAKDKEFKRLGENPAAELQKLEKIAKDPSKLRDWTDALPGGMKEHIHTTVPRVIAYVESAIREGKVSSMMATGKSRELVANLRKLQHENARREVEDEFRNTPGMTNQEKMLRYITKLNNDNHSIADINLKLIRKNAKNTKWIRGGALAGGILLPTLTPIAAISTLTVPYFAERIYRGIKEKDMPMAGKAAARVTASNALGIGGAMIGGLYLAFPLAAIGLLSPEIWKRIRKTKQKEPAKK